MEFDSNIRAEIKEGREDCEDARVIAGKIRECHYRGLCDSKIPFGYGYLCAYGITRVEGRQTEVDVSCTATDFKSLAQKLAE